MGIVMMWYSLVGLICAILVISEANDWEGKIVKGNRNALYLVKGNERHIFPDFWTFTQMGFTTDSINKIPDDQLNQILLGDPVPAIAMFRPDDFMYHMECDDPDRMVNDLGVVANLGDLTRFARVYKRVQQTKKLEVLLLGGSITAGGYFIEFFRMLEQQMGLNVTYHNHGHGATEITCTVVFHTYLVFCLLIE